MSAERPASDASATGVDELHPPAWQPRFFELGDEEAVARMLTSAFPRWPRAEITVPPVEHLRWKLSSHPEAAPLSIVTEHDGNVVGFQGYWLQAVKLDDQELLSRHAADFAVDPGFQRMGIKVAMRQKAQVDNPRRTFQFHFDPPSNHPAFVHMRRKNPTRAPNLLANRVEARVLQVEDFALPHDETAWTVHNVPQFDDRADALWDAASPQFRLLVARRHAYLNWRYADPRAGRFTIKIAELDGRMLGYAVSRLSYGRGFLSDIFALPGRIDVVRSLVASAIADLRAAGAQQVECWLPEHHPYWEALNHYPFDHKRRTVDYRAAPANEYLGRIIVPFLDDPRAPIHVTMGDSDVG
jgi:hypothetical protein